MKKLVEYKTSHLITAQEFKEWKSNWQPGQAIPDQIHQYMHEVVLPGISDHFNKWLATFK